MHVMYVCTYARMYVCIYACMYVCMYACMHVCIHACMHVCMYAYMHVCMCVCMCLCMHMYARMHACMHACMYACISAGGPRRGRRRWLSARSCSCRPKSAGASPSGPRAAAGAREASHDSATRVYVRLRVCAHIVDVRKGEHSLRTYRFTWTHACTHTCTT